MFSSCDFRLSGVLKGREVPGMAAGPHYALRPAKLAVPYSSPFSFICFLYFPPPPMKKSSCLSFPLGKWEATGDIVLGIQTESIILALLISFSRWLVLHFATGSQVFQAVFELVM